MQANTKEETTVQQTEPMATVPQTSIPPSAIPMTADWAESLGQTPKSFAALAHDARNMLSALDLYCDLLLEPGVLAAEYLHYGNELKMVASSSRRLVERMGVLGVPSLHRLHSGAGTQVDEARSDPFSQRPATDLNHLWQELPALPIEDLASELQSSENLLVALAGSSVAITFDIRACALAVRMTGEDLIRILVNLVRNASEAMSASGRIRISLRELPTETGTNRWAVLTVEDNGPGIPRDSLETIFEPGYTTRGVGHEGSAPGPWPVAHRGLGLSIARSIVEAAGGRIAAAVRDPSGACFQIELPVRTSY